MSFFITNEGAALFANIVFKNDFSNRTPLAVALFTNATLSAQSTYSNLTRPSGGSYADIALTDANWTVTNGVATYPPVVFTPSGSDYSLPIQGAAIVTTGNSPVLLFVMYDPKTPTITSGNPYSITFNISSGGFVEANLYYKMLLNKNTTIRGSGLQMVLYKGLDSSAGGLLINATLLTHLTQPSSQGGYAPVSINDSSWVVSNINGDVTTTIPSPISFTPSGTTFSSPIMGYAIVTTTSPYYIVLLQADPNISSNTIQGIPYTVNPALIIK